MQDEALFAMLTPRETLMLSACLRLPTTISKRDKAERVEGLLASLGLMVCESFHSLVSLDLVVCESLCSLASLDLVVWECFCFLASLGLVVWESLYAIASLCLMVRHHPFAVFCTGFRTGCGGPHTAHNHSLACYNTVQPKLYS